MTHCRYHCRVCGGHFSSLEAFDHHGPRFGGCEWPDRADLVEVTEEGVCEIRAPGSRAEGVTIYGTERAKGAREYFEAVEGAQAAPVGAGGAT